MSPDSQRVEIEFLQSDLARWRSQKPDFQDRITSLVSVWLRPALDSLNINASQLKSVLETATEGYDLLEWLAEESLGYPYGGTSLYEQYIRETSFTDNGLYRRFLRRLSNSTTTLWRVAEKPNSISMIIEPAGGKGLSYTIRDRAFAPKLNKADVLLTRIIDMPAGPMLGQAVFNLGPIGTSGIDMSPAHLQLLLSSFAITIIQATNPTKGKDAHHGAGNNSHGGQNPSARNAEFTNRSDQPAKESQQQSHEQTSDSQNNGSGTKDDNNPSNRKETAAPQDSAERERLLERVRKLFAMAQQSDASPHEAEIALRRCQSLMSKYGINEDDLHTSEFGSAEFTKGRTVPSHVKFLASAVAQLYDVIFVTGEAGFAQFRGFDVDAKVAKMTLEYLTDAVERALGERKRAGDFPAGRSAAYDYRLGFATQVESRVKEIVNQRISAEKSMTGSGKSLAIRKKEIVDRECAHDLVKASFSSSRGARDGAAHAAGIDDGSRVSLDQQVGSSAKPLALPEH